MPKIISYCKSKTKKPTVAKGADSSAYIRKPASDFRSQKKTISQSDYSFILPYTLWWRAILNATINARIQYGNSAHMAMVAGSNFEFIIAAKSLQIKTWLLFTAYRNSSSFFYPTIPSPTLYNVPFSHNTCVTGRRQRYRRQSFPRL